MTFLKKAVYLPLLFCFIFSKIVAQTNGADTSKSKNRFYYEIGFGYNFNSGIGQEVQSKKYSNGSVDLVSLPGSYGKGADISFGFGKKLTRNLGLELELGILVGSKNTLQNQYYDTASVVYTDQQTYSYKANTFRINPKLLFEIPIKNQSAFYGKIGYMVGFGNAKSTSDEELTASYGQKAQGNFEWVNTGGLVYGSTTAAGFRFSFDQYISFYVEITDNNLSRKFTRKDMTEALDNGKDILNTYSPYSKETLYYDELTINAKPDLSKPRQAPAYKANYSSVGFRIGFIQYF